MDDFFIQIQSENKVHHFLFSEIYVSKGRKFFVTTGNDHVKQFFEILFEEQKGWKIVGPVPYWIRQMEQKIIETLIDHLL